MLSSKHAYIREFDVVPVLPEPLGPLLEISQNLWWTWHDDAIALFARIDPDLWTQYGHNPIKLLGLCKQARLEELAKDTAFLDELKRVRQGMRESLSKPGWYSAQGGSNEGCCVAYFSAEYGIHESLPIYSGGLGVLSGDHLKSASDLGIPLIGVGLFYRHGYFQQYLSADGWQQEFYPDVDFGNSAAKLLRTESGQPLKVQVELPDRTVYIAVWQVEVGRVRLLLLDTYVPENRPEDRVITSQLYGGDMEMRIRQELVLGIGGMRALGAVGAKPSVLHMNEGHAAFMSLEHIRCIIEREGCDFDSARHAAAAMHLFTTHTPVPAGIDRFPSEMVHRYFEKYVPALKLDMEGLLALGRENVFNKDEWFSMAVLALRTSDSANGVSRLHGKVSRDMWSGMWPGVPTEQVPVGHVTNGVHAESWVSAPLSCLLDKHLPPTWRSEPENSSMWDAVGRIPDAELWDAHRQRRSKLVRWIRRTHAEQLRQRGADAVAIRRAEQIFDPEALTLGFARRFATYKRAHMLFSDAKRLMAMLCDAKRPMQVVVAGKAHPADTQGKELIRRIVHFAEQHGAADRVVFIENYNISVARYLVQGCDVWLNTPRRGLEASGTSGMKAAMNGVLNCSILDGWWDEAWVNDAGWAIGRGEIYAHHEHQDQIESQVLYELLEAQVVPTFYDRDAAGLPIRWVQKMKNCIARFTPAFNTHRMVQDYWRQYYGPCHARGVSLSENALALSRELAGYVRMLRSDWPRVRIERFSAPLERPTGVRQEFDVAAEVRLEGIPPHGVKVECYFGPMNAEGQIVDGHACTMTHVREIEKGRHYYNGRVSPIHSGRHGLSIRVIPGHEALANPYIPGLIAWDQPPEIKSETILLRTREAAATT